MTIDINTKFITLIGTPLKQSFAARMQNAAYAASGLNMAYFYTEADSAHLGEIMDGIRHMPSFLGCAVTKPNKVEVLRYLDETDALCARTGACNTVLRTKDARLIGYNTDCIGFARALRMETDFCPEGKTAFCCGAGGVARAIAFALADEGIKTLYISDCRAEAAQALAEDVGAFYPNTAVRACAADNGCVRACDLVVNATGVGMGASVGQSPIDKTALHAGQLCFDACYNPAKTRFLSDAEEMGARVLNGLGMSLYQGAAQIKIWTGKDAPLEKMRDELLRILAES